MVDADHLAGWLLHRRHDPAVRSSSQNGPQSVIFDITVRGPVRNVRLDLHLDLCVRSSESGPGDLCFNKPAGAAAAGASLKTMDWEADSAASAQIPAMPLTDCVSLG